MTYQTNRLDLNPIIEAIYDTAIAPDGWPALLERLAHLFHGSFADLFARSDDRTQFHGIAFGLDRSDYNDIFLGQWFKRNVWGLRRPPVVTGEIVSTREMVPKDELVRSDIYNLYLAERGLHDGLRLAISVGDGWIQDLSVLRPFSIGPYSAPERAMAAQLLPHLQRAAAVARRLGEAKAALQSGMAAIDAMDKAVFVLDRAGHVLTLNQKAEALLARGDCLVRRGGELVSVSHAASVQLRIAIAHATGAYPGPREAQSLRLPRTGDQNPFTLTTLPLQIKVEWNVVRPPAAMVFVSDPRASTAMKAERLIDMFGLTGVEAELAIDLTAGRSLAEIALRRGRSINTVRTHLRHLMGKAHVNRQTDLVRLLMSLAAG